MLNVWHFWPKIRNCLYCLHLGIPHDEASKKRILFRTLYRTRNTINWILLLCLPSFLTVRKGDKVELSTHTHTKTRYSFSNRTIRYKYRKLLCSFITLWRIDKNQAKVSYLPKTAYFI